MAEYTLYCFAQSGNAYKAALMLELCAADWEPRFVDFFNGETRTDSYRDSVNIMGEVPVLDHDGRKVSQSGVILQYLADRFGRFQPTDDDERLEALRWILFDNYKLTNYTSVRRFLGHLTNLGDPKTIEFLTMRMHRALDVVERHMADREWVVGNAPTIADISMCGYFFYDGELGFEWAQYPNMKAWVDRIRALPGWKHPYDLMPGHPMPSASG